MRDFFSRLYGFLVSEFEERRSDWRSLSIFLLGICLAIGGLMVFRTAGLVFEKDDLRFLWWAHERSAEPWRAFVDPPLFSNYYRPVISLVWWLHWRLFGADAAAHQAAVGVWWLAIVALLFAWGKRQGYAVMGLLICLVFFSTGPGHSTLLWKSWLTAICAIVFHLATLHALHGYLHQPAGFRLFETALFFLLASFSKESALFCLPFTTSALILCTENVSRKTRKNLLIGVFLLAGVVILSTATLKGMFVRRSAMLLDLQSMFYHSSLFAHSLWSPAHWSESHSALKIIGLIAVTGHFLMAGRGGSWRFGLMVLASVGGYFGARSLDVEPMPAQSLGLIIYLHGLWLSPKWRDLAMPLIWLMTAFWPLPVLRTQAGGYAADAGAAFSLVLGMATFYTVKEAVGFKISRIRFLKPACVAAGIGLPLLLFPIAMSVSFRDLFGWATYGEVSFHNSTKVIHDRALDDLIPFLIWQNVYFRLGDRTSFETDFALSLIDKKLFNVHVTGPPSENSYRLEAYSGANYHIRPEDDPLDVWLPAEVGPPPAGCFDDPYFVPERWHIQILSTCDVTDGWTPLQEYRKDIYPIGQGLGHVVHDFKPSMGQINLAFRTSIKLTVPDRGNEFVLTFWLLTTRWDWVESVSTEALYRGRRYAWMEVTPKTVNSLYDWRRVLLRGTQATMTEEPGAGNPFDLRIHVVSRQAPDGLGGILCVDEIRIAVPKETN